jgi:hypothetical protein
MIACSSWETASAARNVSSRRACPLSHAISSGSSLSISPRSFCNRCCMPLTCVNGLKMKRPAGRLQGSRHIDGLRSASRRRRRAAASSAPSRSTSRARAARRGCIALMCAGDDGGRGGFYFSSSDAAEACCRRHNTGLPRCTYLHSRSHSLTANRRRVSLLSGLIISPRPQ